MAKLKAFRAWRPVKEKAQLVASRPYDVLNTEEAKKEARGNPLSFLHVIKPEIDFPDSFDHYAPEIYQKGKENFQRLVDDNIIFQEDQESLYIYRLTMDGRSQVGIVGCAAVDDYFKDVIKKHELTRPDKEEDRKNHIRIGRMQAEPVFFAYPAVAKLDRLMIEVMQAPSEYDFTTQDGIQHEVWIIQDTAIINSIIAEFEKLPATYVADGHHRTAAAALVGKELRETDRRSSGNEEYNYFLAVHFPDNQLQIIDYNRVVKDLNGYSEEAFIEKLHDGFEILEQSNTAIKPAQLHQFGMYLDGKWYLLKAKPHTYSDNDPIRVLDVTILSHQILTPILNIHDLRTDKRIDFVGGIRGLKELEKLVDKGEMKVAFALHPVTMKQLMDIADSGKIMPPKTTWFEPKLRSGLFVHTID